MRVTRIEFEGFRRLARASTNIDGLLTAFVGFNEAGKTSLLQALSWVTSGGALSAIDYNRGRPPLSDKTAIAKVFFQLDPSDAAALAGLKVELVPTALVLTRYRNGDTSLVLSPRPVRPRSPFDAARARLEAAKKRLAAHLAEAADEDLQDPNDWIEVLAERMKSPDAIWAEEDVADLSDLTQWLLEIPPSRKGSRDAKLASLLDEVKTLVSVEHPSSHAERLLKSRIPAFVLFQDADRILETSYDIHPDFRTSVHPAVTRLLGLAGIDLTQMYAHYETGDSTKRETSLERGNERLRNVFDQAWNQSKITVRFNMNGRNLEVLIKELRDDGDVTTISERSDGLKSFVALVAFLEAGRHSVPPVLLIDEAENHLHYDAQADLVSVLLKSVNTTQVFYTTHSPGCLPSDLGTGIRVLTRETTHADASMIKNNFWDGEGPGFSPLLFAMGAGAAAFSVCRWAVLAEGASDMVLLPTLIRQAVGVGDLPYQVAPGLANAHGTGIRVEEVAAKVVYLADGDEGGKAHESALKRVGVDPSRIYRLPLGQGVEDLVNRDDYIRVVNQFLEKMGQAKRFSVNELREGVPVSKAFANWAKANHVQLPSKVEVAYALVEFPARRLSPAGKAVLKSLHVKFLNAFDT